MLRLVGRVLLALVVLVVVAAAGLGGYRALRQNEGEQALAIAGPNGIDEGIRRCPRRGAVGHVPGTAGRNPALILHGGRRGERRSRSSVFLPFERVDRRAMDRTPGRVATARAGDTLAPSTTVASSWPTASRFRSTVATAARGARLDIEAPTNPSGSTRE